jgi:sulfur carrier protein ThiS
MHVRVRVRGWLLRFLPEGEATVDVSDGSTPAGVMDQLRIPAGPCIWTVNGQAVEYDTPLHDGDELDVALMAAGG